MLFLLRICIALMCFNTYGDSYYYYVIVLRFFIIIIPCIRRAVLL